MAYPPYRRRKPFLVFGVERDGARKFCSMMTKMAVTPAATLADLWSITPRLVHCEPCHLRSSTVLRAAVGTSPGAEVDQISRRYVRAELAASGALEVGGEHDAGSQPRLRFANYVVGSDQVRPVIVGPPHGT